MIRRGVRLVGVVVVGVAVLVFGGSYLRTLLPHWSNPFASSAVDHSPAPLLLAFRRLSTYHAASATFDVPVDVTYGHNNVPFIISGDRATFLARGSVDATVDFGDVGADRVRMSPDRHSVTISLPAPRLAPAVVDPAASRVVDRERGLVDRVASVFQDDSSMDQELYRLAQSKVDQAAAASDLIRQGEANTRQMLATLARSLGVTQVNVVFDTTD